jgi:hypothetical protein
MGGLSVSQNTIYGLYNSNTTAAVSITGIDYDGADYGINKIEQNKVYGLKIISNSESAAISGISLSAGMADVENNMICLGYDEFGTALTTGIKITGFYVNAGSFSRKVFLISFITVFF